MPWHADCSVWYVTFDRTRPTDPDIDRTTVVERVETRVDERPAYVAPAAPSTNISVGGTAAPAVSPVWTVTRVVTLIFTVLEIMLLLRFIFRLLGANASQPLIAALYGVTDPLVRPFEGIFSIPPGAPVDIAALLAIVFLFLVAALIVALVRAIDSRSA